jgi:hypothetical protein
MKSRQLSSEMTGREAEIRRKHVFCDEDLESVEGDLVGLCPSNVQELIVSFDVQHAWWRSVIIFGALRGASSSGGGRAVWHGGVRERELERGQKTATPG